MTPTRVTTHQTANDQLLYFTSSSLLPDGRVVVISDRSGSPNLFVVNPATGDRKQLTTNDEGYLHSYVYFDGAKNRGLGKASISLHTPSGAIYYLQGRDVCCVDTDGHRRVLAQYPDGQVTAFTHVSGDGALLCVPTTDARAIEGYAGQFDIDQRVRDEGLRSYLRIYDTQTGREIAAECVPSAWITHVQFHPTDNSLILYNHEWPSDCGIRRMWLFDGAAHRPVRTAGDGRLPGDWTCHEMWESDGKGVVYHGAYENGPAYLGRFDLASGSLTEIGLPVDWRQYGHFTIAPSGLLVSDGYYRTDEGATDGPSQWISIQHVDWREGRIEWTPICRHGSTWDSQDSHPHPIFSADSRSIYYTSNAAGKRDVYRVDVPVNAASVDSTNREMATHRATRP